MKGKERGFTHYKIIIDFAKSFTSILGPIAFIPLIPLLIVPFFVVFTTGIFFSIHLKF